jgi:hypothetical protein
MRWHRGGDGLIELEAGEAFVADGDLPAVSRPVTTGAVEHR